jgi:hypothetical protein
VRIFAHKKVDYVVFAKYFLEVSQYMCLQLLKYEKFRVKFILSNLVQVVKLRTYIWEVKGSNLGEDTDHTDSIFLNKNVCLVGGGVRTESTRHVGHFWHVVHASGDCEGGEFGGMKIGRLNRSTR